MNVAALLQDSPSDDRRRNTQSQQQNHKQSPQDPDRQRPQHERERSAPYPPYVPPKSTDNTYPPYTPTPDPHKSPTYPLYRPPAHQRHPSDPSQSQPAPVPYEPRPSASVPPQPRSRQPSNVPTAPPSTTGPAVGLTTGTPSSMYMPPPDYPSPHPHPHSHPHHPGQHSHTHTHSSHKSTGSSTGGSTPLYPTPVSIPLPAPQSTQSQSTRPTPSHSPPLNATYSDPSPMYHGPPPPPPSTAQRRIHPQPAPQSQSPAMASLRPLDVVPGPGTSGADRAPWGLGNRPGSSAERESISRERASERSGTSQITMDWQAERVGVRERERERDFGEVERSGRERERERERERRENGGRKSSGNSASGNASAAALGPIDDPPHIPLKPSQTRPGATTMNPLKRPITSKKRNEDGMDVDDPPPLPPTSSTRERDLREREREREVRDREREREQREREREREQRERDREDMNIIRAAASTRQQGHTRPGQAQGHRGRENTPTAELLVLQHTGATNSGQGHSHGHPHGHAHAHGHTHGHGHVHNHNHPPHPSHPSLAPHPPHPSLIGGGLAPHSNHPSLGAGMGGLAPHSNHPSLGMGVVPHSSHLGGSTGGGERERGERGGDRVLGVLGVPPHASHPSLPPPPPPSLQHTHAHHPHQLHHHGTQGLAPQHPSQLQQGALPPHGHQPMHTHSPQGQGQAEAQQAGQAPNPPPQRQFQNQFHTQFVPGLQVGPGSPLPLAGGVGVEGREREREREVGGKKARSGVIQPLLVGGEGDEGRGRRSGSRNKKERERDGVRGVGGGRGELNGGMMDVDVGVGVVEWEKEREVKARVTVHLGTFVFPKTPFPYFFGEAVSGDDGVKEDGVGAVVGAKAAGKGKEEAGAEKEVRIEGENGKKDKDVVMGNEKQSTNHTKKESGNGNEGRSENENKGEREREKETDKDLLDRETRVTIIIPSGFLPLDKPQCPRIWGGGVIPPAGATNRETRGRRRVYTDDSDLFLCAVHAGWVTWSEARRARDEGKDMKIEVRVLRCAGTGVVSGGKDLDSGGGVRMKEEVMGRFVGGWGERYFGSAEGGVVVLKKEGEREGEEKEKEKEKERKREEQEEDEDGGDGDVEMEVDGEASDEDNDGRGLVSAGWGSGHDGSGIEILGAEFVEKGTARKALGLGLRNRSQRLSEYCERRAAILGPTFAPGCGVSARLAGRKRRRGWDWLPQHHRRLPNAVALETIEEQEENEKDAADTDRRTDGAESDCEEDTEMKIRTVVFGFGATGAGFKYEPAVLRAVLFPKAHSNRNSSTRRPPRKRRRLDVSGEGEDIAMDVDVDESKSSPPCDYSRNIILETAKESFLLSHSLPEENPGESKPVLQGGRRYVISLVLGGDTDEKLAENMQDTTSQEHLGASRNAKRPAQAHGVAHVDNEPAVDNSTTGRRRAGIGAAARPPSHVHPPDSTTQPQEEPPERSTAIVSADVNATAEKVSTSDSSRAPSDPQLDANPVGPSLPSVDPLMGPDLLAMNKNLPSSPLLSSNPTPPAASSITDNIEEHSPVSLPVNDSASSSVRNPGLSKAAEIRTPKPTDPVDSTPALQSTPVTADAVLVLSPVPPKPPNDHNDSARHLPVQVLRRDLGEDLMLFTKDAITILDDMSDGIKKEWSIEVKRWKWAPQND